MQDQRIWILIQSYLSGECSPEEEQQLHNWLAENPAHQEFFNTIKKVWHVTPLYNIDVDFDEDWKQFSERLGIDLEETENEHTLEETPQQKIRTHLRPKSHPIKQLLRVAVILLLIALPAYYFIASKSEAPLTSTKTETAMQNIQTARGERASMEFSDGSKVTLNSMSTLRFPKVFEGAKRELHLEGEAFFQVAHNEERPLVVHANGVEVNVLGTEFNINSYQENETIEVVVRDGTVAVNSKSINDGSTDRNQIPEASPKKSRVILDKGQRTTVIPGSRPGSPENVSLAPHLAWVNGEMIFDGTPMRTVIQRLQRAYNMNFEVADTTLLSKRLKASFKRERLEKVLGIITFSLDIDYRIEDNTVVFNSN